MTEALIEAQKAGQLGEVPIGAVIAVSYTHLDVYKRQGKE